MIRILKGFKWGDVSNPQRMQAGNIQKVPGGVSERMLAEWIKLGWVEVYNGPTVEKAVETAPKVEFVEPSDTAKEEAEFVSGKMRKPKLVEPK